LFITVKTTKLNREHSGKFETEINKISRRGSRSPNNVEFVFSRCRFAEDGKEMYQEL